MAAEGGGGGVARQAELRRAEGNACFRKDRLGAAIDCYTEAIALCPDVAVYWVNRGLCHFRRKDWAKVEKDSRKALALDDALVKGHYLLGCVLLEKEECALAVQELDKVPDYLCCQITFEIFRDPVITPSGVTYERDILREHLRKVGNFDPVTREPLKEHQLVPNLAIKDAVQAYLKEDSWAYKSN